MEQMHPKQRAQAAFSAEQLPYPPVPAALADLLREEPGGMVFASCNLPTSPYEIEHYVREVLAGPSVADYAVVGFAGHGVNSWAAHFFLVSQPLALFIQIPWGGVYTDAQASRAELDRLFDWTRRLLPRVDACVKAGCIPAGERLVVIASRFIEPGWAWVTPPVQPGTAVQWQPADGMLAAIEQSLNDRLAAQGDGNRP